MPTSASSRRSPSSRRTAGISSSPMWSRKVRATISAPSKRIARCAISRTPRCFQLAKIQPGSWFNAKQVEDAVTDLNEAAGNLGYAFADINPAYNRDPEKQPDERYVQGRRTPRVYVERIDITGNTTTRDKVIRREFRLNEGDAFNAPRSSAARTAFRASASSRTSSRSSSPKARPRTASYSAQRRGKADRPAVAFGRLFKPRAVCYSARGFPEQFHGQGTAARRLGQLFALIRSRSRSAAPIPISSTSRSCSASSFSVGTTAASTLSAPTATRPTSRSAPAAGCGRDSR